MMYDLYVLFMTDGSWRICPCASISCPKQNTYHLTGCDAKPLNLAQDIIDTASPSIESWHFVTAIKCAEDGLAVQEALNGAFRFDMNRPQDTPDVFRMEEAKGDLGNVERYGSWSQTFVILTLKRLEGDGVVKHGTTEDFKKKVQA